MCGWCGADDVCSGGRELTELLCGVWVFGIALGKSNRWGELKNRTCRFSQVHAQSAQAHFTHPGQLLGSLGR